MKSFVFSLVACVCLLAASAWLIATPAFAMTMTANCADGTVSCSGVTCSGQDSSGKTAGYCSCTRSDGTVDTKTCNDEPLLD